jgi:hypothetical protein
MPAKGTALGDFHASVKLKFVQGKKGDTYAYGLVFRQANRDYGFFGIEQDGSFRALVVYNSGIYELYEESSAAIKTGSDQTNQIDVRAMGPDFVCLVNGQVVWRFSENFDPGKVGLGVDVVKKGKPAQVEFDDFEVRAP